MGYWYECGSVALRSGTGTQDIDPANGTPKGVRIRMVGNTAQNSIAGTYRVCHGFGATNNAFSVSASSRDAVNPTDCARGIGNHLIYMVKYDATAEVVADLSAFTVTGFRLNVTTGTTAGYIIYWEAWGGTDLTNVEVYQVSASTTTGDVTSHIATFQPTFGMFAGVNNAAADDVRAFQRPIFGAAVSTTQRFCIAGVSTDNLATSDAERGHVTDACLYNVNTDATTRVKADFVSWETDGYKLNYSTADGTNTWRYIVMLFKGGQYAISTTTAASTTTWSSLGFTPVGASLFSAGMTSVGDTNDTTDNRAFFGAMDGTNETAISLYEQDNVIGPNIKQQGSNTKVIQFHTTTLAAEADFSSFGSGTAAISFSTFDSVAYQITGVFYGATASGATLSAALASATAQGYAATITGGALLAGALATATAQAFAATETGAALLGGALAQGSGQAYAASIAGGASLSAVLATAIAQAMAAQIAGGATLQAAAATATAQAFAAALNGSAGNATLTAALATAEGQAYAAFMVGHLPPLVVTEVRALIAGRRRGGGTYTTNRRGGGRA